MWDHSFTCHPPTHSSTNEMSHTCRATSQPHSNLVLLPVFVLISTGWVTILPGQLSLLTSVGRPTEVSRLSWPGKMVTLPVPIRPNAEHILQAINVVTTTPNYHPLHCVTTTIINYNSRMSHLRWHINTYINILVNVIQMPTPTNTFFNAPQKLQNPTRLTQLYDWL